MNQTKSRSNKLPQAFIKGAAQAAPIVFGYIPVGFAFGVLAQKAEISALNTVLMSLVVYAGSSQLIAVGLIAAGAPVASIIITTFIVNLRHMLMSAAMSPYLKGWRKLHIAGFAFHLTDETFAVHSTRYAAGTPRKLETFGTNLTAQSSWVLGTIIGVLAGQLITDIKPFALDYALPAMFIALLVLQIKDRAQVIVAGATGLISLALLLSGIDRWYVIIATLIGATIGVLIETWTRKRSS